jgi:hypothetical protein
MTNALFRDDVAMPVPECGQLLTASRAIGTDYITSFPFQTNNLGGRPSSESLAISVHLVM